MHIVALLRKRAAQGKEAASLFGTQGRDDLKEKEEGSLNVLEEYVESVDFVGEKEIIAMIKDVVERMGKVKKGDLLKGVFKTLGSEAWEGRNVDRATVVQTLEQVLTEKGG